MSLKGKKILCKPKMIECLTCKDNNNSSSSFCYNDTRCSVPYAVVKDEKVITYVDCITETEILKEENK